MFWWHGAVGLVRNRGKIERLLDFNKDVRARGINHFSAQSAVISKNESVFCWSRFDGCVIIDLDFKGAAECRMLWVMPSKSTLHSFASGFVA